ncbi:LANO_0G17414g1_1 [Lachancea nothofagi CBS 11611]|uniref:LANO_0G17414g1_1 n=1 Tax=Lachancea nothofagi CBS 11611 TaxID=1266666 RepID=A0A1G4KKH1_9SACH|nr:LANO_0G17414g1_1 [Lachancea nothofagi CBS 11611]
MAHEVSLSIEETNKLRLSLGLKPIVADVTTPAKTEEVATVSQKSSKEGVDYDKNKFIDTKLSRLRWNLKRAQSKANDATLLDDDEDENQQDWLTNVGYNKKKSNPKLDQGYYDEVDEEDRNLSNNDSRVKVSHRMSEVLPGKNVILTLKESKLDPDEDEDVLVNEGMIHDAQQAKNVELKRLNQDRRRHKVTIGKGSLESEHCNSEETESSFHLVNGKIVEAQLDIKNQKEPEDKRKVILEEDEENEDNLTSDFAPIKIKKRKKFNGGTTSNKRPRPVSQVTRVALIDEDTIDPAEEEFQGYLHVRRPRKDGNEEIRNSAEDIAKEVGQEKQEKQKRALLIAKMNNTKCITVDENSTFLSLLKEDLIPKKNETEMFQKLDLKAAISSTKDQEEKPDYSSDGGIENDNEKENSKDDGNKIDFQDGLASILGFLKDRNALPSQVSNLAAAEASLKEQELMALKQKVEAREAREKLSRELTMGNVRYTKDELEKIKQSQEQKINSQFQGLQKQKLASYNPDVKLTYKDENGYELTTKEAYKKLSQAFHGTRSNRKKHAKAQQKVENRNKQNNNYVG